MTKTLDDRSLGTRMEGADPYATLRPARAAGEEHSPLAFRTTPSPAPTAEETPSLPRLSIDLRVDEFSPQEGSGDDILVTGVLGAGGMGRVLSAYQRSLDREIAVKTVHEGLVGTPKAASLVAEGKITGHLEHPNIVPVHQLGVDDNGRPLLVMKRIAGVSWRAILKDPDHEHWRAHPPPRGDRLRAHVEILMQVCNAVSFAHAKGVVHRDIKPDNVMLGEFGEVYICDWGIATSVPSAPHHEIVGTPAYLAPEMVEEDGVIGVWTDLYLLGGTLHTVLVGTARNRGDNASSMVWSAVAPEPVDYPPTVPRELADLANYATAADPKKRPASVTEFREALALYLSHETSRSLERAARLRLEQTADLGGGDPAILLRALTECRFAFQHAIEEWPDNAEARAGLARAQIAQVELAIATENIVGARAALAEVSTGAHDLIARVAALEKRLTERAADAESMRHVRRETDPNTSRSARRRAAIAMLVLVFAAHAAFQLLGGFTAIQPWHIVAVSAAEFIAVLGAIVVFRKLFLVNRYSSGMSAVVAVGAATLFLHRLVATLFHQSIPEIVAVDMLVVGLELALAGLLLVRWLAACAAVMLAGALVTVLFPHWAIAVLAFSACGALAVGVFGAQRD